MLTISLFITSIFSNRLDAGGIQLVVYNYVI